MFNSKIIGVGSYAPSNIITNNDLEELVETSDEWIKSRTGILERRISTAEETSDLAAKAAKAALNMANISPLDIDYIIVATITADSYTPSTASIVQSKIGATNASAVDLNAACTGFIYGMEMANALIKSGSYKNILVVGAETLSKIIDWSDRTTCVLFGDGAGAAILTRTNTDDGIKTILTGSDGEKGNNLTADNLALNNPYIIEKKENIPFIKMNGGEVFKFATRIMEDSIKKVIKSSNLELEDIDFIIPHQANYRILEYVSKKLKINLSRFIINLDKYGNTSGASIPIALSEAINSNQIKKGDNIVLVGFGGGLTWGSVLIKY
ncbi:MAG: beta-ketoacyl-ACP synthase III [Sarcina sp.]